MCAAADTGLGILAGNGPLPRRVADAARAAGRPVFLVAFEGQTDAATVADLPHAWVRLGETSKALEALHAAGCTEVVMAGPMKRPALSSLSLDRRSAKAIARAGVRVFGDDGLLSVVVEEIERDGLIVIGIEQVLGGFLMPAGTPTKIQADDRARQDAERGIGVLAALGKVDVGQAVVVQDGLLLAVEAVEGTDAMIRRTVELRREGAGPILVKGRKPGQENRADRPTIGPDTVRAAAEAGFAGIVLEADETLVIDRSTVVDLADRHGLFLLAMRFHGDPG